MIVEEIKIVRMKSGDDIIGYVSEINDSKINIRYPMMVGVQEQGEHDAYTLQSWMPHQLYKFNEVNIWTNDILFISDPTDVFVEYFNQMVTKLEKFITASEVMEYLEEEEILTEALVEKELSVIH
jgi:hypothetical protein